MTFRISVDCHRCGAMIDPSQLDSADWYHPLFVHQSNGSTLQTQLCPACAPRFSLRRRLLRAGNGWPRFVHWVYAKLNGYFWMPCPRCGRGFGGHENGKGCDLDTPATGRCTCPRCPGDRRLYAEKAEVGR